MAGLAHSAHHGKHAVEGAKHFFAENIVSFLRVRQLADPETALRRAGLGS